MNRFSKKLIESKGGALAMLYGAGLKKVEERANMVLWLREKSDNPPPLP